VAAVVSAEEAAVAAKAAQCKALKDDAAAELVGVVALDAMPSGPKPAGNFITGFPRLITNQMCQALCYLGGQGTYMYLHDQAGTADLQWCRHELKTLQLACG